jgi:hypothetical protein
METITTTKLSNYCYTNVIFVLVINPTLEKFSIMMYNSMLYGKQSMPSRVELELKHQTFFPAS